MQSRRERGERECRAKMQSRRERGGGREKEREGEWEKERDILPLYHLYLGIDTPVGRT